MSVNTNNTQVHEAIKTAGIALAAATPVCLVTAGVVAAPVMIAGVALWGLWSLLSE